MKKALTLLILLLTSTMLGASENAVWQQGKLNGKVKSVTYIEKNKLNELKEIQKITYFPSGKIKSFELSGGLIIYQDEAGNSWRQWDFFLEKDSIVEYEDGKIIKVERLKNGTTATIIHYEYDKNNHLTAKYYYSPNGTLKGNDIITNNESGLPIKVQIYNKDGVLKNTINRKFNKQGRILFFQYIDETKGVDFKEYWKYDKNGNFKSSKETIRGNKTSTYQYTAFDKYGNWTEQVKTSKHLVPAKDNKKESVIYTDTVFRKIEYYE